MAQDAAPQGAPIPAFVNARAGSAAAAREAVSADSRFELREVEPDALEDALRQEIARGTPRVVVAGGDGTLTTAARALAGSQTALAVLPGGTLNHFARDLGLPSDDAGKCLESAVRGTAQPVDAATVNDVLFLGTSSVGAYVTFVRTRERLEDAGIPYRLASLLASAWTWIQLRAFRVDVHTGEPGAGQPCESPLVFLAVGERSFERATLGARVPGGGAGLQLLVVRTASRAEVLALALRVASGGVAALEASEGVDVSLVPSCEIRMRRRWGRVAMDGELVPMPAPLRYRVVRGALLAVVPPPDLAAGPFTAAGTDRPA